MRETAGPADILVVENKPEVWGCLTRLLGRQGHSVATATDGRAALAYLRAHPLPRLILLALLMPGMDGWEFLRERQRLPALRDVPVVVFSAVVGFEGPDPLKLGAAEVLLKPFELVKVLDVARRYCRAGADRAV